MSASDKFYEAVLQYRKTHRISQEDMAERCGICARYYQDLENGKVNASLKTALRIAGELDISLDTLVKEERADAAALSLSADPTDPKR